MRMLGYTIGALWMGGFFCVLLGAVVGMPVVVFGGAGAVLAGIVLFIWALLRLRSQLLSIRTEIEGRMRGDLESARAEQRPSEGGDASHG